MKILVDADACPVKNIVEEVASFYKLEVLMFIDTSHILKSDYSNIITVCKGNDAVDLAIINRTKSGDIVVTQDYALAAMVLGKKAYAINQNGFEYSEKNIDRLLFERHLAKKVRRAGGRTNNPSKRTQEDDFKFKRCLIDMIDRIRKISE